MFTNKKQLWLDAESTEGTLATLTVADAQYAFEPVVNFERAEITDQRANTTLSKAATLIAQRRMRITFGLDLKGSGAAGGVPNVPALDIPFRMCGMRREQLWRCPPNTVSAAIQHNATFLQAGSNATGVILGAYAAGTPTRLHYRTTGTNGQLNNVAEVTFTNPDLSTGTFTPSTTVAHGYMYHPYSQVQSVATRGAWTGTPTVGEIVTGATSNARGVLLDAGIPLGSSGSVYVEVLLGTFTGSEVITGLSSAATCTLTSTFALSANVSASVAVLVDGMKATATGVRGNWTMPLKTGDPCRVNFDVQGLEESITTLVLPAGAVYDTVAPPRFVSAGFSLDGNAFFISNCEITLGNVLNTRDDANAAEGAVSFRITDRDARIRLDPEMLPPGVYDYFAKWQLSQLAASKIRLGATEAGIHNSAQTGRIVWIDLPQIQYVQAPLGDRNGIVTAEIEGALRQGTTAGDDEIRIYFL